MAEPTQERSPSDENNVKAPNLIERAKEEIEAITQSGYQEETHGARADIDEDTKIEEVKAPGVFGRIKEEIEALVQSILPKK